MNRKVIIFITLFLMLMLSTGLLGYQLASSRFNGNLEDLPYYIGAPAPYTYIIDTNGSHYFAYNGTTGQEVFGPDNNSTDVINDVIDDGGGLIFLNEGEYVLNGSILLKTNVTLTGVFGKTILKPNSGMWAPIIDTIPTGDAGGDFLDNWKQNIVVSNLVIDMCKSAHNKTLYDDWMESAVLIKRVKSLTIEHCIIQNAHVGIRLVGSDYTIVKNNRIYKITHQAIDIYWNFMTTVENNYFDDVQYGLELDGPNQNNTGAGRWTILNNHIRNYSYGICAHDTDLGPVVVSNNVFHIGHNALVFFNNPENPGNPADEFAPKRCVVSNNVVTNNTCHGLYIQNSSSIIVTNNYFEHDENPGSYSQVKIENATNIVVSGLKIDFAKTRGVHIVASEKIVLSDFCITTANATGILVENSSIVTIDSGLIDNCTQHGINIRWCNQTIVNAVSSILNSEAGAYLQDVHNFVISNGIFRDNGWGNTNTNDGIRITSSTYGTIIGNVVFGADQDYGIRADGTEDYNIIIGNNCYGNTQYNITWTGSNTVVANNIGESS